MARRPRLADQRHALAVRFFGRNANPCGRLFLDRKAVLSSPSGAVRGGGRRGGGKELASAPVARGLSVGAFCPDGHARVRVATLDLPSPAPTWAVPPSLLARDHHSPLGMSGRMECLARLECLFAAGGSTALLMQQSVQFCCAPLTTLYRSTDDVRERRSGALRPYPRVRDRCFCGDRPLYILPT